MKILHTADWHLGKRLDRFERHPEQQEVLTEICEIAEKEEVDAVIIAGDLYDSYNPPIESVELFYQTVKRLSNQGKRAVVAIAGNHDSPYRIEAPDPLAREWGIIFAGFPQTEIRPFQLATGLGVSRSAPGFAELKLPNCETPLRLLLTPYANEVRLRKALNAARSESELREALAAHWQQLTDAHCDENGVNLMVAHLFMINQGSSVPEEPEEEKPIYVGPASAIFCQDLPSQLQYVAMGHLHRPQYMGGGPCPVVYPGSPLSYSFAEAAQRKKVMILDMEAGKEAQITEIELNSGMPLLREKFSDIEKALIWLSENQHCYVELTLVADEYISSEDRSRIAKAHPRIIGPIPELTHKTKKMENPSAIDLSKSMEELFGEYFFHKKGQEPNEDIKKLFREILRKEDAS